MESQDTKPAPPAASPRVRAIALVAVLLVQTLFFALFLTRPLAVEGDNERYEQAGWNIAIGRGNSLPLTGYGASNDPEVYAWVCDRHPEACYPDTTHPSALFMPGYSVFIGAIYAVFGRSLVALTVAHLALLWLLFALFEWLAARTLSRGGYAFAMGVAATYPFLAAQATRVMSDELHAVLWLSAFVVFMGARPGVVRGVAFGALLSFSTLVRPYSMFIFPALWALAAMRRWIRISRREWLAGALAFLLPFAAWTARNAHWYGRFLPMTTGGAGAQLYHTTLEWDLDISDPAIGQAMYHETTRRFGDVWSHRGNRLQFEEALRRISEHPLKYAGRLAIHVPRVWISLTGREWALPLLYLGGLLVAGLAGAWVVRRDPRFQPLLVAIGVNWAFLLPFPGEARRTLPMRLPMVLLAGMFVGPFVERFLGRRARVDVTARS
jgi:4-amino-4-deoxy-L-arabinose transferase-like glycosyltransferase